MFLSLSLTLFCSSGVLGSPGAAWTDQETLTVKAKLYTILGEYGHGNTVGSDVRSLSNITTPGGQRVSGAPP